MVGTVSFVEKISHIIKDKLNIKLKSGNETPPVIKHYASKNIGYIYYSGKNAIRVLNWVYSGSAESNRMDRKYNLYLMYKNRYKNGL